MVSQIPFLILVMWNFTLLFLMEVQKGLETILLVVSIVLTILKIYEWLEKRFKWNKKK